MSSSSIESIIVNAKRLAQRLKSREADADRILAEAEEVNNQLETMRQVRARESVCFDYELALCVLLWHHRLFIAMHY